jgi:hypothetical protein
MTRNIISGERKNGVLLHNSLLKKGGVVVFGKIFVHTCGNDPAFTNIKHA